ncbi:hypothetical protein DERF_015820 [Dermatophagoides farinae]|uniref:long-chain-fatty-acid--CoA ligase n=1 Tax=Dermatophagoides farinae TaxID=6954 RepID=A0A922HMU6_DERFA|nr:hypothetical protein DERF_015820 [Dermatophagoides farinae]
MMMRKSSEKNGQISPLATINDSSQSSSSSGSSPSTSSSSSSSMMNKTSIRYLGKGLDYQNQSIPYKDNPVERISKQLEHKRTLYTYQYEQVKTLNDIFDRGHRQSKNGKCLGQMNTATNTVDWINYDVRKHISDGLLVQFGLQPRQSFIGIYSINCMEYTLIEYACYRHSLVIVPIYDTLGPNIASFIANQTELTIIACDNIERLDRILEQSKQFHHLKHLIWMKSDKKITMEMRKKVMDKGFQLHILADIEKIGSSNPIADDHKPKISDLAVICYTSGTTSTPKGVILTHENVIASIAAICIHLMDQHATVDDTMISILPLAHMFQRIGEAAVFIEGGKVVYYSGDIRQLAAEILIIRPTIMLAVPRLLNRIYDAIYAKVRNNILKRCLLHWAYRQKRKDLARHVIRNNTIWDRIVFDRVRQNMGSRLRLICVGSAPLSADVLDFLRVAIDFFFETFKYNLNGFYDLVMISEGYGQTECVGPCTATLMGDETTGHVGPPLVGSIVKLADVPDMGYNSCDGRGEILVKGPVVFQGYYKMPEQTAEILDNDGWLHTGDIGYWSAEGTLRLIDRKKNIFKLSQGEYIAPEKIENILINSQYVQQIFIYGDGFKSMLIAIVVPDLDFIQSLDHRFHIELPLIEWTEDQLNSQPLPKNQLKELIINDLKRVGQTADLKSFELPKNIYVKKSPFTIEEGLLTPTLKSKRNAISKHFEKEIQMLYKELEQYKPNRTTTTTTTSTTTR